MSKDTAIKKAYVNIVAFLQENKDKKVSTVLDQVVEMCQAKSAGGVATASHRDANGNVVAVRCNYFGLWFPTSHVDFGQKQGSATGLNSMCKEGANAFSLAQRTFKKGKEALLDKLSAGELAPADIAGELEKLEAARVRPVPFSIPGMGWEKLEDCLAQTPEQLDALVAAAQPQPEAAQESAE